MKIYVAAVERSGKSRDRMKLSLPPKLVEKLDWVPVISFCKIFIPSYVFDVLLCQSWRFLAPNRLTLRTTLMYVSKLLMNITHFFSSDTSLPNLVAEIRRMVTKQTTKEGIGNPKKKIQNMQKTAPTTFF